MNPSSESHQTQEQSWGFLLLTSQTSHWKNNAAAIRKCELHLVEERRAKTGQVWISLQPTQFLVRNPLVRLSFHKWHALRLPNHGSAGQGHSTNT